MHQVFGPPHFIKCINSIENVQRHFTKRISSITELPYLERLAVMDLEPLELRRIKRCILKFVIVCLRYHLITSHVTIQCEPTIHGRNVST